MLAGGCATAPLVTAPDLQFTVAGKFGIRDGEEGYAARFNWRHYASGYDIEVWGPLGQGRTQLRGNAQTMRVSRGDQLLAEGAPQEVMYAYLGWTVPVDVLPAWIKGRPEPGLRYDRAEYDASGHFIRFQQAGWQVVLSAYTKQWNTPGRIVAQNGTRKVTVLIREFVQ